ncbi:phenylalanine ammonia-lyase [Zalerion maritima]|uniref:Phenylalanine ammonia-lyase n=1 Tax=Zalerion maritima TaxID=339359 RepID=A0AAD5RXW5_9PEZI|nr:phenylalanine ammonia-lyase [Zalerion maritima]
MASQQPNGSNMPSTSTCSLESHTAITFKTWLGVFACSKKREPFTMDGSNLTISRLVAIALHGAAVTVPEGNSGVLEKMEASVQFLSRRLQDGWTIYGVNTGVGGSADARTGEYDGLQIALLQHLQSAFIPEADLSTTKRAGVVSNVLPSAWSKASLAVRANQCLRGHSGIRIETVKSLTNLLSAGITPLIPKRGSISASGDLMPLSYIAGTITGNSSVPCEVEVNGDVTIMRADIALKTKGLEPIQLQQKEALALVNGTAPSAAAAAINVFHANQIATLAQLLTTFTAECLAGNVEWASEFIHQVHPQLGQSECAKNMRSFLGGSKLATGINPDDRARTRSGLCQDRYSTRTAPQWLGPYLEDLAAASKQVKTELNSTSDNPLVQVSSDGSEGDILHGGNFQATAVTSAMDKARQAMIMIGRLLFSQCTELINPMLNNNLPTNLVADCPSMSFTMKGIDVNMTAYMSELASLASPIPVFPAEMQNQGVNSMALLSTRKTAEAIEVLSMMIASHIFVLCQAADLRAFQEDIKSRFSLEQEVMTLFGVDAETGQKLKIYLEPIVWAKWQSLNTASHSDRAQEMQDAVCGKVWRFLHKEKSAALDDIDHRMVQKGVQKIAQDYEKLSGQVQDAWLAVEARCGRLPTATYLASGSGHLYRFIREHLKVPFHRGVIYDPLDPTQIATCENKQTIGTWATLIYESLINGSLMDYLMPNAVFDLPTVGAHSDCPPQLSRVPESELKQKDEQVVKLLEKAMMKLSEQEK